MGNTNLNDMRELKNVVNQIMSDKNLALEVYKEARELFEMKLHNAGLDAIRGNYNSTSINEARAARYLEDLIHAIIMYMEDGNDACFTSDKSLYPDAELPVWSE